MLDKFESKSPSNGKEIQIQPKTDKSMKNYKQSIDIELEYLQQNHSELADSYNNIALSYQSKDQHSGSMEYYKQAIDIYLKSFPPNHMDLASCYNNMALLYYSMGIYEESMRYY